MLHPDDRSDVAMRFGADDSQVARDHLVSHLLAGLEAIAGDEVVFSGGTALARTHLSCGRLSEDIDLYTVGNRRALADRLTAGWPRSVRREFPRLTWNPELGAVRDVEAALLVTDDAISIRIQLLDADATYRGWPIERRRVEVRYRDVAPVSLIVPTLPAFVAMKASAWRDRQAARDLFDLASLARLGAIDSRAVALLREVTSVPLVGMDLAALPRGLDWHGQLAHQCRLDMDAETALADVRRTWSAAANWDE